MAIMKSRGRGFRLVENFDVVKLCVLFMQYFVRRMFL